MLPVQVRLPPESIKQPVPLALWKLASAPDVLLLITSRVGAALLLVPKSASASAPDVALLFALRAGFALLPLTSNALVGLVSPTPTFPSAADRQNVSCCVHVANVKLICALRGAGAGV